MIPLFPRADLVAFVIDVDVSLDLMEDGILQSFEEKVVNPWFIRETKGQEITSIGKILLHYFKGENIKMIFRD